MSASSPGALDPRAPVATEFHEAVLGLTVLLAKLDRLLDAAVAGAPARHEPPGELEYALLGLFSVRKTLDVAMRAVVGEGETASEATGEALSAWGREQLR